MAKVIVTKSKLDSLNSAISAKCGTSVTRTVDGMTSAVSSIDPSSLITDYLTVFKTTVTVGSNNVTNSVNFLEYIASLVGVNKNRIYGVVIHSKGSYSDGEVGRMYINLDSTNCWGVTKRVSGAWGNGTMSSNSSACAVPGTVFDVFYSQNTAFSQ